MEKFKLDFSIPKYLEDSIDLLIKVINDGQELIDCEQCEVISDINLALVSHYITDSQVRYLRRIYDL